MSKEDAVELLESGVMAVEKFVVNLVCASDAGGR